MRLFFVEACGRECNPSFAYKTELRREGSSIEVCDEARQAGGDDNGLEEEAVRAVDASRGTISRVFFTGNVLGVESDGLRFRDVVDLLEDEVGWSVAATA